MKGIIIAIIGYRSSGSNRQQQQLQLHGGPVWCFRILPINRTSNLGCATPPTSPRPTTSHPLLIGLFHQQVGSRRSEHTNEQKSRKKEKKKKKGERAGKKGENSLNPLSRTAASREGSMNATNKVQTILCMVSPSRDMCEDDVLACELMPRVWVQESMGSRGTLTTGIVIGCRSRLFVVVGALVNNQPFRRGVPSLEGLLPSHPDHPSIPSLLSILPWA